MSLKAKKYRTVFLVVAVLEVIYFLYFINIAAFDNSLTNRASSNPQGSIPELTYFQNSPFHSGPIISEKIDHIIIIQSKTNRNYLMRFFCICADDKVCDLIIQYNREVFQSIQLGTTFQFNCEIQI